MHLIGALVGVLALATAGSAAASPQFTQSANVKLVKKSGAGPVKAGTSVRVAATLRSTDPGEPGGKPKSASRIVIRLPQGTRANTRASVQCNLGDEDVKAGRCPRRSLIGRGTAKANLFPLVPSTTEDVRAYVSRGGLILLLTDNADDPAPAQTIVLRATISRRGVIAVTVPVLQAVPGVFGTLTDFSLRTQARSRGRGVRRIDLIRAPLTCVPRRGWVTRTTFTYRDGSAPDVRRTRQGCRR